MSIKRETGQPEVKAGYEEIKSFFEAHGQFLEKYAGDSSIKIEPSPQGLGTFAIDLENGVLYAEPSRFGERGWSEDKILSSVCHEYEHFKELKELLDEKGGDITWQKHGGKIKANRRFGILDNCIDDIKIDRRVEAKAPILDGAIKRKYREDLFQSPDLTDQPKHLQFAYALKRRAILDEKLILDPEVQEEIDKLDLVENNGTKLLEYATRPETPMSMRLKLQERFLEPAFERLFQEDVEEKKKGDSKKDDDSEAGEGESGSEGDDGKPSGEDAKKKSKGKAKKSDGEKHAGSSDENADESGEIVDPEAYFKDEYDEFDKNNPEPIDYSSDEIKKKIEEYVKSQQGKSAEQEALEAYAKAEGVSLNEIKEYQRFFSQLESLENPETGEKVIEELRRIFKQIIAERKKERYAPKHPLSEGEILINPAEAVAAVMAGENEPEVWQSQERKDLPQELFGDFDVTLVCDRSGSMEGEKAREQRKAAVLLLEALKEFCNELDEARSDLKHDLNVRSEVWGFGGENEVKMLKPLSDQLTEKQRVSVYKDLADTPGAKTMDFLALEKIKNEVTGEEWQKIKEKKLRKIIIVLTDGASDDKSKVQGILREFDAAGVAVAGVGVTASGKSAEATYAPNGLVCETAGNLAAVLADLLKKYLKDLLIKQ